MASGTKSSSPILAQNNSQSNYGNENSAESTNLNNTENASAKSENKNANSNEFFDDGSEEDISSDGLLVDKASPKMRHPAAPSKWRTQELIMQSSLPSYDKIQNCQGEVRALAAKSINHELMLESRNILTQSIVAAPELYHWCFYLSAMQLDNKLESLDVTVSFLDKYKLFIAEMKGLWIQARALDAALGSKRYFGYVRARYKSMAQEYFGRSLTVISAPLGDKNRVVLPKPPKAASQTFDDF